jgi:hypothetical protein
MSNASDSQNRSEQPIDDVSEAGTSPEASSSSDDGERSTPSGMPPAATRGKRRRTHRLKMRTMLLKRSLRRERSLPKSNKISNPREAQAK